MKNTIIAVVALTVAFFAVNCQKKADTNDPKESDPTTDIEPSPSVFSCDAQVMADQKKLSDAQASVTIPGATSAPAGGSATSEPTSGPTAPAGAPAADAAATPSSAPAPNP